MSAPGDAGLNTVRANFDQVVFESNTSANGGGVSTRIKTTCTHCQFRDNFAHVKGGGIYAGWADLSLDAASVISGNYAPEGMGPGIAWVQNQGGTLTNDATGEDAVDLL